MIPAFGPVPGGPELTLLFLVFLLGPLLAVGVAYWVFRDATRRGVENPQLWALAVALGGVVGNVPGLAVLAAVYVLVAR